ncbi:MAG: hypothetical protein K9I94_09890 [Bacteroidales bacterium]|nr:hypothetical protein [Bacteroidales bacterium]
MKAIKYFLTVIIIFAMGAIILNSCSKETNNAEPVNNNKQTKADQSIENRILHFKDKMTQIRENPNLKSGSELMELDSVVWYIEAALNYSHADATSGFNNLMGDSAVISIPLTNGKVTIASMVEAYDAFMDSIAEQYATLSNPDAHLVVADISLQESNDQTLTMQSTTGYGIGIPNPFIFDEDDHWLWGLGHDGLGGKCDGYQGPDTSDAAIELEKMIHTRKSAPTGSVYYTDISELTYEGHDPYTIALDGNDCNTCSLINPNDDNPDDNLYDFYVFRSHSLLDNHHGCLPDEEMNNYITLMEDLLYNVAHQWYPNQLNNKKFISINNIGDLLLPGDNTIYYHYGTITYGIEHISIDPPEE